MLKISAEGIINQRTGASECRLNLFPVGTILTYKPTRVQPQQEVVKTDADGSVFIDSAVAAARIKDLQVSEPTCCCCWRTFLTSLLYLLTRWHWNLPSFHVKMITTLVWPLRRWVSGLVKISSWFCTSRPMLLVFKRRRQQFWRHEAPRFICVSAPDPASASAAAVVGEHERLCHTRRTTTRRLIYAGLDHGRSARLIAGFDDCVCSNFDLILIHANLVRLLPAQSLSDASIPAVRQT